ncbi:MAG: transporter [Candidatus Omnitrophica bacterium]|nr:transporter [Candidatus Omnitrophota bacterium]
MQRINKSFLAAVSLSLILHQPAFAIPINSDAALTAHKGEVIVREQIRYTRKSDDPSASDRTVDVIAIPTVLVYGITEEINVIGTYPIVYKDLDLDTAAGRASREAAGFGDLKLLGKYLFLRKDRPGKTLRADVIGGLEFPTGNTDEEDGMGKLLRDIQAGKGSWNPIAGTVLTWQTLRQQVDFSLTYTFNTEGHGFEFGDVFNHDFSYQFRIWPWNFPKGRGIPAYVNLVAEANGVWEQKAESRGSTVDASGGYTLFLSPGIQLVTKRFIAEMSIQFPTIQALNGEQPETTFVLSGGLRAQF